MEKRYKYKCIEGDYIIALSQCNSELHSVTHEAISAEEYANVLSIFRNHPSAPTGFTYKLKADTLTWELVELPPIDDTDDEATESDYIDALQDLGVEVN